MACVLQTPEARNDVKEIARYLAHEQHRRRAAEGFVQKLNRKARLYAEHPLMGAARPDLGADYRCFVHQRWVAIYRPLEDGILILRVVDGARDFGAIFGLPPGSPDRN